MAMSITPIRLPSGLLKEVEILVDEGHYSSKSDVVRYALRKLVLEKQIGSIPNTGDSVKEIRKIRKKLSKKIKSYDDIKKLNV